MFATAQAQLVSLQEDCGCAECRAARGDKYSKNDGLRKKFQFLNINGNNAIRDKYVRDSGVQFFGSLVAQALIVHRRFIQLQSKLATCWSDSPCMIALVKLIAC